MYQMFTSLLLEYLAYICIVSTKETGFLMRGRVAGTKNKGGKRKRINKQNSPERRHILPTSVQFDKKGKLVLSIHVMFSELSR
jgi:hypothetical protein